MIHIRNANREDLAIVYYMICDLYGVSYKNKKEFLILQDIITIDFYSNDTFILIAEDNRSKKIVSVGIGKMILRPHLFGYECWIRDFYVSHDNRRKGVGTYLLKEIRKLANNKKCKRIRLETVNENEIAIKFYIQNGFKQPGIVLNKNLL